MLFFSNGIYPTAIKYLSIASGLKPDDADVQKNLAISYFAINDKSKSHEILLDLYRANQNKPHVQADITYLMFHMDLKDQALSNLSKLKQVAASDPIVLKMSAEIAESKGDLVQAARFYEDSFNKDPKDIKTALYYGNLLAKQKNWAKAINLYYKALDANPNEPEFLERLGNLLITCPELPLRDLEKGKEYCERTFIHISSRPNVLIPAGRNLAYIYASMRDKGKALATIRQTINIARRANAPKLVQKDLEDFYSKIQAIPN
jgi:tetratricopeptide (TPR) repeat protein